MSATSDRGIADTFARFVWRHALDSVQLLFRPHADEWVATATSAGQVWEARAPGASDAVLALMRKMPNKATTPPPSPTREG